MTDSEPNGRSGPLRFRQSQARPLRAGATNPCESSADTRILPMLRRWLEADTLQTVCSTLFDDLNRLESVSRLLIIAQSHDSARTWAVAPAEDALVREVDRVLGVSPARVDLLAEGRGRVHTTDSIKSIDAPEFPVDGFDCAATVGTDGQITYRVMWAAGAPPGPRVSHSPPVSDSVHLTDSPLWPAVTTVLRNLARMEHLRTLSHIDSMTGIHNRAYFNLRLTEEVARAQRFQRPLSLSIFDIDHFKSLNDTYGHQTGDTILRQMAEYVRWTIRAIDVFCRVGGDEFAVLMPDADTTDATHFADRLLSVLQAQRFTFANPGTEVQLGVSMGAAVFPTHADQPDRLLWCADMALLEAKHRGRSRFLMYEESFGYQSAKPE